MWYDTCWSGITYFGTNEEIYTPNQIMRTSLNRAAVIINEIFCKSVSYPTKTWEELDAFHRESKIAAADHILMKIRVLMQDEDITELTPKVTQEAYGQIIIRSACAITIWFNSHSSL